MTHFFQPLDLTVNGAAKQFMKNSFTEYYANSIREQMLDNGKQLDEIEVDLRLSILKPLHAQWLIQMYNYFTTKKGKDITKNGWKKAGIADLFTANASLPNEDPFKPNY